MAIQITKIDDKADGFTVEFTVTNTFKRTFAARPNGEEQMNYARTQTAALVNATVERPEGVQVVVQPEQPPVPPQIIDLNPAPAPPEPPVIP